MGVALAIVSATPGFVIVLNVVTQVVLRKQIVFVLPLPLVLPLIQ